MTRIRLEETLTESLGPDHRIEFELSGGGMSRVFVVRDLKLDRRIVVKAFHEELAESFSIERFNREIMVSAGLQHPNIVPVLAAGVADSAPYFTMPFVEGESLHQLIRSKGRLGTREAISILRGVAHALAYAHEREIVHRDIKPANVLISSGTAVLTDFGVAKALGAGSTGGGADLTRAGMSLGTPTYMSPEQVAAETVDHRTDIYSFGVMAFEMVTGTPPFTGSIQTVLAAHLSQPAPSAATLRDDIPAPLASLISRCMEKSPQDRPQSAVEMVEVLDDPETSSGVVETTYMGPAKSSRRLAVGIPLGVGVVAAGAIWLSGLGGDSRAAAPQAGTIAVLPFENVGADSSTAYFASGMTDELIGQLSRINGLRVASRTSSLSVDRSLTPEAIGDRLNVGSLIEGTVRIAGTRLRVTAQLVSVNDGFTVWSETFDSELSDVFDVQDSIAGAIATVLRDRTSAPAGRVSANRTGVENYDTYLQGLYFLRRRGPDELEQARELFTRVVVSDSTFAPAWASLASVYHLLPLYTGVSVESIREPGRAAANKAIQLDPNLADAHAALGELNLLDWDFEAAIQSLERASELDPGNTTVRQWLGEAYAVYGRLGDAGAALGRAAQEDPLSPVIAASRSLVLAVQGDLEEALGEADRAVAIDSSSAIAWMMRGVVSLYAGDSGAAVPLLERAASLSGNAPIVSGLLGYAYAKVGDQARAGTLLNGLSGRASAGFASARGRIKLGLGDLDGALDEFEAAVEAHDPVFAVEILASPLFDPLRGTQRFVDLVTLIGLPPAIAQ